MKGRNNMMQIRQFQDTDIEDLFDLMRREGEEWTYCHEKNRAKYTYAMNHSIAYVVIENNILCGYVRCKDDNGFGIYILDLLIDKQYRGKEYGRMLMKTVCDSFPEDIVYVTSDADLYYEKLGCQKEGTVFRVMLT